MTTRATEPKRGGSGGHVYIVGVADDSKPLRVAIEGFLVLKKGRGLVQEVEVYTVAYVHVRGRVIRSAANIGTTRPPLATVKRGLHLEYKRGKSTDRPEISV